MTSFSNPGNCERSLVESYYSIAFRTRASGFLLWSSLKSPPRNDRVHVFLKIGFFN